MRQLTSPKTRELSWPEKGPLKNLFKIFLLFVIDAVLQMPESKTVDLFPTPHYIFHPNFYRLILILQPKH